MKITLQSETIYLANKPIDFRRAIDGLCSIVVEDIQRNPSDGIYIFYNRNLNRIKILGWHNNGYIMVYKRLERGRFFISVQDDNIQINSDQLSWLLAGVDWRLLTGEVACESGDYC